MRAAQSSGDAAAANDARSRLADNWRKADAGLPGAAEALAGGGR
jgi:hypothetical protein